MQHWQYVAVVLGVFFTTTMLLGFAGRVLHRLYNVAKKVEEALGVDELGKTLRQNVTELQGNVTGLKAALDNGIRADVRRALELGQQNADSLARVEVKAEDAQRAANQLHAEVNVVIDAVVDDRARVWKVLGALGYDRRQQAIEDV